MRVPTEQLFNYFLILKKKLLTEMRKFKIILHLE